MKKRIPSYQLLTIIIVYEFQEEIRKTPRDKPYDPEAEEGITRWRRTEEGELVIALGCIIIEASADLEPDCMLDNEEDFELSSRNPLLCRLLEYSAYLCTSTTVTNYEEFF